MPEGILPRPEVQATSADQHGALDYAELTRLGIAPNEIIDFSVNSNPFGPSPVVREALRQVAIDRYPDRESLALRQALAEKFGLDLPQILIGNGTAELLWLLALAFVRPGDRVLILKPTFGEYARSVALMGGHVESTWASEEDNFSFTPEIISEALHAIEPRLAFICNPNNPTGATLSIKTLGEFAGAHPTTLFVIDEAYIQFAPGLQSCISLALPNVLVLRSMTKDYALAGLRLGFAAGPIDLIEALAKVRPPWNVNAVAQEAGLAAIMDDNHLSQSLTHLRTARADFLAGLQALGLAPIPSATHYFILKVGNAAEFRRRLLEYKIQVRDCASFGLPDYIRVATKKPEENTQLLSALKEIL
ncbi:MAG: histidinol-phosphate aminotransferase family protein [Anaerolineales bacterium]|nr:histidinol-phosphate aminotransferase family protein [Anaerolineales bacterium]